MIITIIRGIAYYTAGFASVVALCKNWKIGVVLLLSILIIASTDKTPLFK